MKFYVLFINIYYNIQSFNLLIQSPIRYILKTFIIVNFICLHLNILKNRKIIIFYKNLRSLIIILTFQLVDFLDVQ